MSRDAVSESQATAPDGSDAAVPQDPEAAASMATTSADAALQPSSQSSACYEVSTEDEPQAACSALCEEDAKEALMQATPPGSLADSQSSQGKQIVPDVGNPEDIQSVAGEMPQSDSHHNEAAEHSAEPSKQQQVCKMTPARTRDALDALATPESRAASKKQQVLAKVAQDHASIRKQCFVFGQKGATPVRTPIRKKADVQNRAETTQASAPA